MFSKSDNYGTFIVHHYLGDTRSFCDWLTPNNIDELKCKDGTFCKSASCCNSHGGRAKCPSTFPFMCAEKKCAGGNDYCCGKAEMWCLKYAGGPRKCGKCTPLGSSMQSN